MQVRLSCSVVDLVCSVDVTIYFVLRSDIVVCKVCPIFWEFMLSARDFFYVLWYLFRVQAVQFASDFKLHDFFSTYVLFLLNSSLHLIFLLNSCTNCYTMITLPGK